MDNGNPLEDDSFYGMFVTRVGYRFDSLEERVGRLEQRMDRIEEILVRILKAVKRSV